MGRDLLNGCLLIHKEKNLTSHDVVQKVRNLLNQKSVGHAGTLDPMAEGLLVLLLGSATKLSSYLLNADKSYRLTMKFGLRTDSYDKEGQVLSDEQVSLDEKEIKRVLQENTGDLNLAVPFFSAVKVQGKKLYDYARSGQEVERPCKKMSFYDLQIHEVTKDQAEVSVSSSKGAYIRSWVHHLGEELKVGACLIKLDRMSSGHFSLKEALKLQDLKDKLGETPLKSSRELKDKLGDGFLFPFEALPQFPFLEITRRDGRNLMHGKIPTHIVEGNQDHQIQVNKQGSSQILKIIQGDHLMSLLEFRPYKKMRILKNFPLISNRYSD